MRTPEQIEGYLLKLGHPFEPLSEGMWVVRDEANRIGNIAIRYEPPILALRVKVMGMPATNRETFFKKLLALNATDLVHGAYALEDDNVVWVDTLELENLDFNELQASIEAVELAISAHCPHFTHYRER
jgi:hypothetical protein